MRAVTFLLVVLMLSLPVLASSAETPTPDRYFQLRSRMVREQMIARGISDASVLAAMRTVPRHLFVPRELASQAYGDYPLPIGDQQTISQPYIVALMTELGQIKPKEKVLEIGTGSGYQAAVLAELTDQVFSIEILQSLGERARKTLDATGYGRVKTRIGDGYNGWQEHAPFDVILVTAAPDRVPRPLLEQLKPGGRLIIPVGPQSSIQNLQRIRKTQTGQIMKEDVIPVRFVPLVRQQ